MTTDTLNEESGYLASVEIYDSLLRPRETQTQAVNTVASRILNETVYDTHGWVTKTNSNYYDSSSNPDTTLYSIPDQDVAQQTTKSYDGLGREVEVHALNNTASPIVDHVSYTQYTGDKTISVPPQGGVAEATTTDAVGHTTELDQYTTAPTVTTGTAGGFTTVTVSGGTTEPTTYTYNSHGLQTGLTDPNNDTWTTGYDFLGEATTSTDPDAGTTTTAYDPQGRVWQTTDNAGNTLSYKYDPLGRKIAEYNGADNNQHDYGTTGANEVASWTYDNSNQVSGVTNPVGHLTTQSAYTTAGVFTTQELGYNAFGESLGESYTIPGTTSVAGTYTYKHSYTTVTGLPKANLIPAVGGMAQEITTTGYSTFEGLDEPTALNGLNGYAHNVSYTRWGQIAEVELGTTANNAYDDFTYDPLTGAVLTSSLKNTAVSNTPLDQTTYTYDAAGNPTSNTETRSGTATETQCYTYDPLDRLTDAWTAASSCATTPTQANAATTVADQIVGSAYWTHWTFDNIGQVKTQSRYSAADASNTTTTYTYGTNNTSQCGGQAGGGTNTLNATTTTGPSGTTTATYCSNTDGQTTSMPGGDGQNSLAWNAEGKLWTDTTSAGTSEYIYDATGDLVERSDPGKITFFLPSQQIAYDTSNQTATTTRFIALPGGAEVVESATTGNHRFELTSPQGTATTSLDATLQNPTYQQYTPYGATRGTSPATWTDPNGYLGKAQDPADDLVTMGAREYDPDLGRFMSVDPVLETSDPQQLNGYTYAGDNPITRSDPTGDMGMCAEATIGVCGGADGGGGSGSGTGTGTGAGTGNGTGNGSSGNTDPCAGLTGKAAFLCGAGSTAPCDWVCLQISDESTLCGQKGGVFDNGTCTITPPPRPHHWWNTVLEVAAVVVVVAVVVALVVQPELLVPALEAAQAGASAFGDAALGGASLDMATTAGAAAATASLAGAAGLPTVAAGLSVVAAAAGASYEGSRPSCESFKADTAVLTASGKQVPISTLKPGDKVKAKNTSTGKSETQTVNAVTVNHDTDLYDLTILTKHGVETIHATANHPIWDATRGMWIQAAELPRGDQLLTADGTKATVIAGSTPAIMTGWMWDLTISRDHDFYVVAGDTPVLVHNCNGDIPNDPRNYSNPATGRSDASWSTYDKAIAAARDHAGGDLGSDSIKMYDYNPATGEGTGTLIGEQTPDRLRGWRIDGQDGHVNWWDWSGGKKGAGGVYGHDWFPEDPTTPGSRYIGWAPWEDNEGNYLEGN